MVEDVVVTELFGAKELTEPGVKIEQKTFKLERLRARAVIQDRLVDFGRPDADDSSQTVVDQISDDRFDGSRRKVELSFFLRRVLTSAT